MRPVEVPKVFVDESSARILLAALYRPRTALQICKASGVPVAEVFARLRYLEKKGLLTTERYVVDANGKDVAIYHSMFHNAYVFIDKGKLKVRFQLVSHGQAEMAVDGEALL